LLRNNTISLKIDASLNKKHQISLRFQQLVTYDIHRGYLLNIDFSSLEHNIPVIILNDFSASTFDDTKPF
jgi:hypothetical protein